MAAARILVADDQDDLRMLVRTLLTRAHGWEVVEASDGDEALAQMREQSIDLAVLDQRMPGLTGVQVARTLRDERFEGPIVLFSAYLDPAVEADAADLGLLALPKSEIGRLADVAAAALDEQREPS